MADRLSGFFRELNLAKLAEYPRMKAWGLRFLRIIYYILDEFTKDRCLQTAASLAYTTLLSLVPLVAISLAILSRFTFSQDTIQDFLMKHFLPEAAFQAVIMDNIHRFASNTAALSVVGGLFLAVTAIALLNTVEGSFNAIWRVTEKRSFLSKFTAFWSVITFSPILLGASLVLTSRFYEFGFVGGLLRDPLIQGTMNFILPLCLIFVMVFIVYRVLPHTKVKTAPAMIGAASATILFYYARWGFGIYLAKYARFDKIYGILGTLPAFLIWIYISWLILLLGAEVAYTFQYHRLELEEKQTSPGDPVYYPYYGIRIVLALSQQFHGGKGPLSAVELADALDIPYESVDTILSKLRAGSIVASVDDAREQYLPVRDPDQLTLQQVIETLHGEHLLAASQPGDRPKEVIEAILVNARGALGDVLARITIKDLSEKLAPAEVRESPDLS